MWSSVYVTFREWHCLGKLHKWSLHPSCSQLRNIGSAWGIRRRGKKCYCFSASFIMPHCYWWVWQGKYLLNMWAIPLQQWPNTLECLPQLLYLIKSTGLRDLSVLYNVDNASGYLPALCTLGLTCAESGECVKFEAKMVEFVNEQLIPEARVKVFTAFPQIGYASTKVPISILFW